MNFQKTILTIAATVLLLAAAPNCFAKRTIDGYIKMPDGTPAKGVGVVAWDEDDMFSGKNDYMGKAITDARGYYKIHYKGGPWDTKVPGSTSFRPDIFLTIYAVQAGSLPVKKTTTRKNWRMSKNIKNWNVVIPGIMGKITKSGRPVSGCRVYAYDRDGGLGGKDDPIGITYTLSDGRYVLLYGGKHYDSTPPSPGGIIGGIAEATTGVFGIQYILKYVVDHGWSDVMHRRWTQWRPDIYIKVQGKKSSTHNNWPHRKTLIINMDSASFQQKCTYQQRGSRPGSGSSTTGGNTRIRVK